MIISILSSILIAIGPRMVATILDGLLFYGSMIILICAPGIVISLIAMRHYWLARRRLAEADANIYWCKAMRRSLENEWARLQREMARHFGMR